MDSNTLRLEAINEANVDIREQKKYEFKQYIKSLISDISENNITIQEREAKNKGIRNEISSLDLELDGDILVD